MKKSFKYRVFYKLERNNLINWLPDKTYLKLAYWVNFDKRLDLKNPKTFNEKLQWLKLNDRNPLYTTLVDKYKVKEWVADKIGEEYIIPLLGVWDNANDIDFDNLPNQFVLKTNHGCGGIVICKDKQNGEYVTKEQELIKEANIVSYINNSINNTYFYHGREWPYKNVDLKVIAEKFLPGNIEDYKFICCDGEVKCFYIESGRDSILTCDFYDLNFVKMDVEQMNPKSNIEHTISKHIGKMIELASILSKGIPQVRVDFMVVNDTIYFGELTFYNWCGFGKFEPNSYDKTFGDWIDLSKAYKYHK